MTGSPTVVLRPDSMLSTSTGPRPWPWNASGDEQSKVVVRHRVLLVGRAAGGSDVAAGWTRTP